MPLYVLGTSFRSAPLELLERLAIDPERRPKALAHLVGKDHVQEGVLLATCNRVEVYAAIDRFHGGSVDVRRFLAEFHHIDPQDLTGHLYDYYDDAAVRHLFAVAAGLDSMVVGEAEVLTQTREAFAAAKREGSVGPVLSGAFQRAIRSGRRVRAETAIGAQLASTVSVGLDLTRARLGGLAGRRALVVGAGKMGRLAGRTLLNEGIGELVIANRSPARAAALARDLGARTLPLTELDLVEELAGADLVVASTAAVAPTVSAETVAAALLRRGTRTSSGPPDPLACRSGGPLVMLDLGVPRDIDPAVRELPGVVLADLDGLRVVLETSGGAASAEVDRVRELVDADVADYLSWQRMASLGPTIRAMRTRAEQARQRELSRAAPRLAGLDERQMQAVEALTRGLVNKLLHDPMVRGKALAAGSDGDLYTRVLRELYAPDDEQGGGQHP
jgi:glutamyl-tRNA reductase